VATALLLACVLNSPLVRTEPARAQDRPVDFRFQVRPILADRCFKCHGPDERARKGGLRLDLPDAAYAARKGKHGSAAIVPGKPDASQLIWRIASADPADRMPPPESKLTLSEAETEILRRWIAQGAEYRPHWAFLAIAKPAIPAVRHSDRVRNPVDAFVQARLDLEGLEPGNDATPETWLRRVSFDLRGLPPTVREVDEFLRDTAPAAYEHWVDRFLASSGYGEQQARDWLDLARYADTHGYQSDVERDLSPWRDWVIRAFNENLPYDQFLTWQLAGDLLPSPTPDQQLATAFNRMHRQTNEGGSVEEEFRAEYVADRVATAGTAFLGLTVECARCHDHKYDPISQKDFYRLSGFFNNIDESGLYSHFTQAVPTPALLMFAPGQEEKHRRLQTKILDQEKSVAALQAAEAAAFEAWLKTATIPPPQPVASFPFELVDQNHTPDVANALQKASLIDGPEWVEGRVGKALKFNGDNSLSCDVGAFHRTSAFSISLWLQPTEAQDRAVVFHRSRAWTDSGSRGYELVLEKGHPAFGLIHFWPGNALQVRALQPLPLKTWSHLTITYDGSSRAAGVQLYLNGKPSPTETIRDHLVKDIVHRAEWGDSEVNNTPLTLAGRFRDAGFKNGLIDEFQVYDRCLTPYEVRRAAGEAEATPDRASLLAWYSERVNDRLIHAGADLRQLREAEDQSINDIPEIMVMSEMTPRRPTFVLKRGAYDAPGEAVEPGVPEAILPFAADLPRDRLGLARWMTDPKNPLTARVAANRIWRSHFGRGLVETEGDFGTQGSLPTHPELLDYLARTFIDSGWDVKALHKLIVLSATYRQSSVAPASVLAVDPENHLLARGPKRRLRAEEIRDEALALSGLLSPRVGGRSVRPYQPAGLWEEAGTGKSYQQDKGEGLYRRSLYTFWRRTAPPPSMVIFDAPTREVCRARRETTTTPLQALVLLNDPQFVEAARGLAEQLLRLADTSVDSRVRAGFRQVIGRFPMQRELEILRQLYGEQLERFAAEPQQAKDLLKIGDHPADPALKAVELAAATMLASALMNLDEFVTLR